MIDKDKQIVVDIAVSKAEANRQFNKMTEKDIAVLAIHDELELVLKCLNTAERVIFDLVFRDKWAEAFDFVGLPTPCTLKQYKEIKEAYYVSLKLTTIDKKGGGNSG